MGYPFCANADHAAHRSATNRNKQVHRKKEEGKASIPALPPFTIVIRKLEVSG